MDQPHKEFLNGAKEEGPQQSAAIPPEAQGYVQHEGELVPASQADANHSNDGSVIVTGEVATHKPQNAEQVEINPSSAPQAQTHESILSKITGSVSDFFHGVHKQTKMNIMFTPDWDANKTKPYKEHLDSLKGATSIEHPTPEVVSPSPTVPVSSETAQPLTVETPSIPVPTIQPPIQGGVEQPSVIQTPSMSQTPTLPSNVLQFPGSPDAPPAPVVEEKKLAA
jgi:hypothetical protein